ncbi:D-alanine--D-alanine ligase [compost metagenome]
MLLQHGVPYVLEVNTLPGMTETSLFPQSAQAASYTFSGLLDAIIAGSLQARREDQAGEVQAAKEGKAEQAGQMQAAEELNEAGAEAGEQAVTAAAEDKRMQEVVSHA